MSEPLNRPPNDDAALGNLDWSGVPEVRMPEALSAALLDRTRAMVRGRARRRRLRLAAGWGLAYAAGICTVLVLRPRDAGQPPAVQMAAAPAMHQPRGVEHESAQLAPPTSPRAGTPNDVPVRNHLTSLSPEELRERAATAPRAEQIRLLRLAGDRYLYGAADMRAALDCYQQVIELTPHDELARIDADDGWLLAELKQSAAQQ